MEVFECPDDCEDVFVRIKGNRDSSRWKHAACWTQGSLI